MANHLDRSEPVRSSTQGLCDLEMKLRSTLEDTFTVSNIVFRDLLRNPLGGDFDYPAAKRYTEANVDKMRKAEAGLDEFWAEIEFSVKTRTSLSVTDISNSRLLEPRELYRTPEWIPPLVARSAAPVLRKVDSNTPRFGVASTADVLIRAKPKAKIKTRGISAATTYHASEKKIPASWEPENATSESPTAIKVPKRAYKVFAALLPSPSAESHQRVELAWDELLQAMNTIGLQPVYGSVWSFTPKAHGECMVEVKRSIQFHEPKEIRRGSKIPANMVRTFGRRLKHAFGWESGMFGCE